MRSDIKLHILFWLVTLSVFVGQSLVDLQHSVFGYFLLLGSVYAARWICGQSFSASWIDMFRMFFLSFFALSLGGLAIFASFVEPGLHFMHYVESLINISCLTAFSLFPAYFVFRIRKKISSKANSSH